MFSHELQILLHSMWKMFSVCIHPLKCKYKNLGMNTSDKNLIMLKLCCLLSNNLKIIPLYISINSINCDAMQYIVWLCLISPWIASYDPFRTPYITFDHEIPWQFSLKAHFAHWRKLHWQNDIGTCTCL